MANEPAVWMDGFYYILFPSMGVFLEGKLALQAQSAHTCLVEVGCLDLVTNWGLARQLQDAKVNVFLVGASSQDSSRVKMSCGG